MQILTTLAKASWLEECIKCLFPKSIWDWHALSCLPPRFIRLLQKMNRCPLLQKRRCKLLTLATLGHECMYQQGNLPVQQEVRLMN